MQNRKENAAEKQFEAIWGKPIAVDKQCEHVVVIPAMTVEGGTYGGKKLCGAYYDISKTQKRAYLHFPDCSENICPIKHPELLDGEAVSSN